MQFVGKKIFPNNSWAIIHSLLIAPAKDNFKLSQVVPVVVIYPIIALVTIRATDPVAILIHCNYSCPFVQFVGKKISLRTICLEGTTERSDGNRVRSARIGEPKTMCLAGTTPQDM